MQVEFRTGIREVPDYLADMMRDIPTHTMTFEEAVEKANWRLASDYANRVQGDIIKKWFRDGRPR